MTNCCAKYLNYAGCLAFHEWDEYFGAEVVTLRLVYYICEFCESGYFLAVEAFIDVTDKIKFDLIVSGSCYGKYT